MEQSYKSLIDKNANIAVLCGGMSNEREVSLRSGNKILEALKELGYTNSILIDFKRLHSGLIGNYGDKIYGLQR